jgi:IS30 family transposase
MDTLIGKNHKGVLLTAVERKSKFTLIKKVPNKKANRIADAIVNLFELYQKKVFTIASDNGKEFTNHDRIAKELKSGI